MRLIFKQRLFSWFDSYDIFDENGSPIFSVAGRLSWGHRLEISDAAGSYLGMVKEELFHFLPCFQLWNAECCIGNVRREFSFFHPVYHLDYQGWRVEGDFMAWDYDVTDASGRAVAHLSKELFHLTDTYVLEIAEAQDALLVLMIALAIDAANCSSQGG